MGFWVKPQKRTDDLLLKQLREIRNQKGSRIAATKPLLDAIIAEICGLSNVGYNWSEAQCAKFFKAAVLHYLPNGYDREQLLAASGFGPDYEKITSSATARRSAYYDAHPRLKSNGDPPEVKSLEKRETSQLQQLADAMRAEVQNGSITALLFKVFTETELRELGLEGLANQAAQHERKFYADGASLKTEKKICNLSTTPA